MSNARPASWLVPGEWSARRAVITIVRLSLVFRVLYPPPTTFLPPVQVAVTVRPPDETPRPNALTAPTAVVAMVPVPKRAEKVTVEAEAAPHAVVPASRGPADALFEEADLPSLAALGNGVVSESGPGRPMGDGRAGHTALTDWGHEPDC